MPCSLFFWVGLVSLLGFELLFSHFGVLGIDCYCICHLVLIGWSPCSFKCSNTCWVWHFSVLDDIMKCLSHVTLMCPFLNSTLWKPNGSILPPIVSFFSGSLTWARVCFPFNKHSFRYRANMCKFRGRHLVISLSYHTNIPFVISPLFYNITYLSWLVTSYNGPPFTVLMWSLTI